MMELAGRLANETPSAELNYEASNAVARLLSKIETLEAEVARLEAVVERCEAHSDEQNAEIIALNERANAAESKLRRLERIEAAAKKVDGLFQRWHSALPRVPNIDPDEEDVPSVDQAAAQTLVAYMMATCQALAAALQEEEAG